MPAAAVIPASVASIKVAAVKRLAVECQYRAQAGGRWDVNTKGGSVCVRHTLVHYSVGNLTSAGGCVDGVLFRVPFRCSHVPVRYKPPRLCT